MSIKAYNPYLDGVFAPVQNEVHEKKLKCIKGEVPKDLFGAYVRNGPNPKESPEGMHHWFDGDGMVHSVFFENGEACYRNRYVGTRDLNSSKSGIFKPADVNEAPVYRDTANTDVVFHDGELLALWYISGRPVRLDARTLETKGELELGKDTRYVSAHSKVDRRQNAFLFFDYALYEPWMSFGEVSASGETHFSKVELPSPRLPHDMAFTENHVLLMDLPVVFTDKGMAQKRWTIEQRNQPTRFGVVPRRGSGSEVKWFETEPCYIYHVENAYEEGDEIVLHACQMIDNKLKPRPDVYGAYTPMVMVLALQAVPIRWRLNLKTGAVKKEQLSDKVGEFPALSLDHAGYDFRYGYHMTIPNKEILHFDGVRKYDHKKQSDSEHKFGDDHFASEVAFAPRTGLSPHNRDEDDGYLITFVTSSSTLKSEVHILNAKALDDEPVAVLSIDARVPSGFHATFAPGDEIS